MEVGLQQVPIGDCRVDVLFLFDAPGTGRCIFHGELEMRGRSPFPPANGGEVDWADYVLDGVLVLVESLLPALEEGGDLLLPLLLQSLPCHLLSCLFVLALLLPLHLAEGLDPLLLIDIVLQSGRKMDDIGHFLLLAGSPESGDEEVVLPVGAVPGLACVLVPEADDAEVRFILHPKLY